MNDRAPNRLDPIMGAALEALPLSNEPWSVERLPNMRAERIAAFAKLRRAATVERRDFTIPAGAGRPGVPVRVYRPLDSDGTLPCVVAMHGGGYVFGSYDMDDPRFDLWCPDLRVVGVSVDYRLAPEHPYPAALDDCYTALEWTFEHAVELGIDPSRIAVAGASAGGGLAACLTLLARDRGRHALAGQLLLYPMVDDRCVTASTAWDVPIWTGQNNAFAWRSYLGALHDTTEIPPYAAALRATRLDRLPPTFLCVGGADILLDEVMAYGGRLVHAGVQTELHVYAGAPHGFDGFVPNAAQAVRCRRDVRDWLEAVLTTDTRRTYS